MEQIDGEQPVDDIDLEVFHHTDVEGAGIGEDIVVIENDVFFNGDIEDTQSGRAGPKIDLGEVEAHLVVAIIDREVPLHFSRARVVPALALEEGHGSAGGHRGPGRDGGVDRIGVIGLGAVDKNRWRAGGVGTPVDRLVINRAQTTTTRIDTVENGTRADAAIDRYAQSCVRSQILDVDLSIFVAGQIRIKIDHKGQSLIRRYDERQCL